VNFDKTQISGELMPKDVTITATLMDAQAWAFAQFLKRVGLDDYKGLSVDTNEA
jgi:hypothetical protein